MILAVMNAIYAIAYIEAWKIQDFYIHNCINCIHNCEEHSLLDFTSAVQYLKYLVYNFKTVLSVNVTNICGPCFRLSLHLHSQNNRFSFFAMIQLLANENKSRSWHNCKRKISHTLPQDSLPFPAPPTLGIGLVWE